MQLSYRQRLTVLSLIGVCGALVLLTRLFALQVIDHETWRHEADKQRAGWRAVRPVRGSILDAAGRILARDEAGYELAVRTLEWTRTRYECTDCGAAQFLDAPPARCQRCRAPGTVHKADERDLRPLARLLRIPVTDLEARVKARVRSVERIVEKALAKVSGRQRRSQHANLRANLLHDHGRRYKSVVRDVPYEAAREVSLHPRRNPGLHIRTFHSRRTPAGSAFAHILGRVSSERPGKDGRVPNVVTVTREDGSTRSLLLDRGWTGLERRFDAELTGEPGWVERERDPVDRSHRVLDEHPARLGLSVQLTIDAGDQERAALSLRGAEGALVVIDAETGAVLALATAPSYDPESYAETVQRWAKRAKSGLGVVGTPLIERAVGSFHTPGSIMKPFTALAAMLDGHLDTSERILCERDFYIGDRRIKSLKCNSLHGEVALHDALVKSCNIYFQTLMVRLIERDKFGDYLALGRRFGFGSPTGIETETSRVERLAHRNWDLTRTRERHVPYASATGQGIMLTSPAQIARAYAALMTGWLPRLHVVRRVGERGTRPQRAPLGIPRTLLEPIRIALREVPRSNAVLSRHGLARHQIACKTGTAQLIRNGHKDFNAWIAGFAPAQRGRPPIAFAMVILRSMQSGAESCAPRLEEFFRAFYAEGAQ